MKSTLLVRLTLACSLVASLTISHVKAETSSPTWPDFSTAGFFGIAGSPRQVLNFDPGWLFLKGNAAGAEAPDFDDTKWEKANLPHGLEILPENASGMRNYQGPAWYRKHFAAPTLAPGGRAVLYFEAVMGKCTVWVNGHKMTDHFGGYLPFAVDITDVLLPTNVVAVLADNSDDSLVPPGQEQKHLDFTYMGGIYRDVFLIETGGVRVTFPELSPTPAGGGIFVALKALRDPEADLEVRTEVENKTAAPAPLTVRSVLEDQDHHDLLTQEQALTLAPGEAKTVTQDFTPKQPHLWTPNDPYLHFVRTEIVQNGKVIDSLRTRFGIRLFEVKGQDGLYLNHKPIGYKINGANRHQDYVYVGNALPKSSQWRDARLLREGGCEFVRSAHYPMSPAFLDACDALGLMVTDATPGWQFFSGNPLFAQRVLEDSRNMVRRDRNRPAMFFWETTLNETWGMKDLPTRICQAARSEYPFPGFLTAADAADAVAGGMDIPFASGNKVLERPDGAFFQREYGDQVDNFSNHNSRVRVNREWGEHALDLQASIREEQLDTLYGSPLLKIGGALWAGIDHQRGYHPDPFWGGLLDVYRIPRYSYFLYKSQYDPDLKVPGITTGPMVAISQELTPISESDVVVYTNCQQVRLTWQGKVVATQGPDSKRHEPHPPVVFKNVFKMDQVQPELSKQKHLELVAEGLINGQVVCQQTKPYPQRSSRLHIEVDGVGVPLQADGSDFVPVRAYVVDEAGTMRVLESPYITFHVDGPGEIIGGEFNHANPMKAEFGTSTALVRAGTKTGTLHVTASTDGLKSDSVDIPVVAPSLPLYPPAE